MKPPIDRMSHLRDDPEALDAERQHPDARFTPIWRGQSLLEPGDPPSGVWLPLETRDFPAPLLYLGRTEAGHPRFTVDLGAVEEPLEHFGLPGELMPLRAGWKMPQAAFETLGYALGMVHWHRTCPACERCGHAEMTPTKGGFERVCTRCDSPSYPRTDPAMMVLITRGDRCVLARQPRFPEGVYSALAGFVEPGESLEEAVWREAREEVGLEVESLAYQASQPWPFPRSLMLGFRATTREETLRVDHTELEDAKWLSKDEIRAGAIRYPPPVSLAHRLITEWLDEP